METNWLQDIDRTWTLFLDRDGVLNERRIDDYVKHWGEWHWLPGVLEAVTQFSNTFGKLVVITNQRGISRGLMRPEDLSDIHARMKADISAAGGRIDAVFHCPHGKEEGCDCRKPLPGMFFQAQAQFPEIFAGKSVMVGDSTSDMGWAHAVGAHAVAIGEAQGGEFRVADLREFAEILKRHQLGKTT